MALRGPTSTRRGYRSPAPAKKVEEKKVEPVKEEVKTEKPKKRRLFSRKKKD
jgi:hypothetical protein